MKPLAADHRLVVGSVAFKLLEVFANNGGMPGFTEGELAEAIKAHPHRIPKIYQRVVCDLIPHGWKIVKYHDKKVNASRFWMVRRGPGGCAEAKKKIAELRQQQAARIAARMGKAA